MTGKEFPSQRTHEPVRRGKDAWIYRGPLGVSFRVDHLLGHSPIDDKLLRKHTQAVSARDVAGGPTRGKFMTCPLYPGTSISLIWRHRCG